MRSHEERIAEVKRRIAEKERRRKQRQERIAAVFGVAACLAVIVGVSLFSPIWSIEWRPACLRLWNSGNNGWAAVLRLIYRDRDCSPFVLGVCVTIACFRICLLHKDEQSEEQKGDNANGTCR